MNMKKGFTLIEMLVTVGLFAIIVTIAVGAFVNAERTERQVSSLIAAQSNVSLAVEQMSRNIRTGYLFCHDPGDSTASPSCSCTVASSSDPNSPMWTCQSLDFYDANGNEIKYSWAGGALAESVSGNAAQSITGNTVSVKYLKFKLFGQTEGDHWPPRVTISIGIAASSTDAAVMNDVFNLETTVSARTIDCTTGNNPQC
jgi:prepilin-type N-terminal cleavage/methylation domain-containing protein